MKTTLAALILCFPVVGNADTLPLEDGAYLRNLQSCHLYKANDLDFIDFEVTNNGREFGFPEVGCLVYTVKKVRKSRYYVESDCREGGIQPYQSSNFIDVLDDMSIRIDGGERHYSCTAYLAKHKPLKDAEKLIEEYHEHEGNCRGGSPEANSTEIACDQREAIGHILREGNWCLGKHGQSRSEYQWHLCNHFSEGLK